MYPTEDDMTSAAGMYHLRRSYMKYISAITSAM